MKHIIMIAALCCATLGWAGQTSDYLAAMDNETRANAMLDLEYRGEQATQAVNLWNAGNYGEAVSLIRAIEDEIGSIAVSISWRRPIETPATRWGADVRVNTNTTCNANFVELLYGDTGNLFVIAKGDSGSTYWFWVYMSTNGGTTWAQTYRWGNVSTALIDIDGCERTGWIYIAYSGTDGVAGDTMVRVRRVNSSTGAVDGAYGYKWVLDAASNVKNIAFEPNRASGAEMYVTAIDVGGVLYYRWTANDTIFTAVTTPVTNADYGLDMDYGFMAGGAGRLWWACYVSTADSLCMISRGGGAFQQYVNRAAVLAAPWLDPAVAQHGDSVIVFYTRPDYTLYYTITYDAGVNWIGGGSSIYTDSATGFSVVGRGGSWNLAFEEYSPTAPEIVNYSTRQYGSGTWQTRVPMSEHDAFVDYAPSIEYLGAAGIYGIAYVDDAYDVYFDRIDWTGVSEHEDQAKAPFIVKLAPNPARGRTTLSYTLKQAGAVNVSLFDAAGRQVEEIVNQTMSAGTHSAAISQKNLAAGVYFVKVSTPEGTVTKKLTLVR